MGGVCCVLSCTFAALAPARSSRVTTRRFSGVRGLFTTVLTGNVNRRLGRKLCHRCLGHGRSVPIVHKGVSVPKAVGGGLTQGRILAYRCSRLSRGGLLGRVLGAAIVLLVHRTGIGTRCGDSLGGRVLFFSTISAVRPTSVG